MCAGSDVLGEDAHAYSAVSARVSYLAGVHGGGVFSSSSSSSSFLHPLPYHHPFVPASHSLSHCLSLEGHILTTPKYGLLIQRPGPSESHVE